MKCVEEGGCPEPASKWPQALAPSQSVPFLPPELFP